MPAVNALPTTTAHPDCLAHTGLALASFLSIALAGEATAGLPDADGAPTLATTRGESLAAKTAAPPVQPVTDRRLYVTGMVGSSLEAVNERPDAGGPAGSLAPVAAPVFNGEGAIGVAIPRPLGGARFEVEGRAFDDTLTAALAQEWSTMANLWRDLSVTEYFGAYAGGGIGVGGFSYDIGPGSGAAAGVAWQVGGGLTYALTERLTLDVGYRLHGLEPTIGRGAVGGGLMASEVLLSVRVFEPLRGWLR